MRRRLAFGIIGCGNIAGLHGEAVRSAAGAELRCFLGRSPERAAAMGARFGVPALVDAEAFFARKDLDAVLIGTPSGQHAELGLRAAEAGWHVLVEKPIDVTIEKARGLIEACRRQRVKLGVIFQARFLPDIERLRAAVKAGTLGRLLTADAYVKWYREPAYYAAAAWRGTRALDGGGALINQAIHTIDLLQHLAGPVASVCGFADHLLHRGIEAEDTAVAALRFESGAMGVIEASTALYPGAARRIELAGERGSVVFEGNRVREWRLREPAQSGDAQPPTAAAADGAADPMSIDVAPHRKQIEDFVAAIDEDRPPRVDGEEGLQALRIVLAIYRASTEGRSVALSELGG
ncbi:MAG: Gfo/Idh/MocA family oxidoreductase [Vicinamibacteria bacterium]|jgi:predicted dehydrogenase|nr:Gfo/Idh/MocA family oxidoreductase [Vicinamibacteria bacterium]